MLSDRNGQQDTLISAVEKRIASMLSAAEDAITSLKHELKTKLLKLPKKAS